MCHIISIDRWGVIVYRSLMNGSASLSLADTSFFLDHYPTRQCLDHSSMRQFRRQRIWMAMRDIIVWSMRQCININGRGVSVSRSLAEASANLHHYVRLQCIWIARRRIIVSRSLTAESGYLDWKQDLPCLSIARIFFTINSQWHGHSRQHGSFVLKEYKRIPGECLFEQARKKS